MALLGSKSWSCNLKSKVFCTSPSCLRGSYRSLRPEIKLPLLPLLVWWVCFRGLSWLCCPLSPPLAAAPTPLTSPLTILSPLICSPAHPLSLSLTRSSSLFTSRPPSFGCFHLPPTSWRGLLRKQPHLVKFSLLVQNLHFKPFFHSCLHQKDQIILTQLFLN